MSKEANPVVRLTDVVAKLYDLLEPLDQAGRARAIRSAMVLLDGDTDLSSAESESPSTSSPTAAGQTQFASGRRAQAWLRTAGLTDAMLGSVFHVENGQPELIASPPGKQKREQSINCYLLAGARNFLATDEPRFADVEAVAECKRTGCYDMANHANTRTKFGNRISGSKSGGYVLTSPGLDQVAAVIREIAGGV
jgi:hypothetical protein